MLYPVFLDIAGQPCLIVGGGRVGLRKIKRLLKAGAVIKLIDPKPLDELKLLADEEKISLLMRSYQREDMEAMRLVFAASSDSSLNFRVASDAREKGILCNIADNPSISDFFLPALLQRGDLSLAVSTGGQSPALARKIRMDLEDIFDEAYLPFLKLMGRVRSLLLAKGHNPEKHKKIFRQLVDGTLLEALRSKDSGLIRVILSSFFVEEEALELLKELEDFL